MKLPSLNLPTYQFDIKSNEGQLFIYDVIRKKSIQLTPEEWVRQNFVQFLIDKGYSKALMKIEGGLKYNTRLKRSDIVIYNNEGKPQLLVECKSDKVKLQQSHFDQAAVYNQTLKARYLVITNGLQHYCAEMDFKKGNYTFLEDIPGGK